MHHRVEYSIHRHQGKDYIIATEEDNLIYLGWNLDYLKSKFTNLIYQKTSLHQSIYLQLQDYFSGARKSFDIKTKFYGTEFQLKVWNELIRIKYGETRTYGDIANIIGSHKAQRAVGAALGKNPIAIIYPCHRVIGKNRSLTGFAGGLDEKMKLLKLEQSL